MRDKKTVKKRTKLPAEPKNEIGTLRFRIRGFGGPLVVNNWEKKIRCRPHPL